MVTLQDLKELRYLQGEIAALAEREREIAHRMTYAASVPAAARVKGDDGRTGEERYRDALEQVQESLCRRRLALAEKEAAAEVLLQAKGFSEAVVSINGDAVDVVVNAAELTDVQRAQIEDIVKRKTDIAAENIVISTIAQ